MDQVYYVRCIVEGMERYMRLLAQAEHMTHHPGDVEWIAPKPGAKGPACVYRVSLDAATAAGRIDALRPGLESGQVPAFWYLSPTSTPANLTRLLEARGFENRSNPDAPEPGMALDLVDLPDLPVTPRFSVHPVRTPAEFASWVAVVNEALHGWDLLDAACYTHQIARADQTFFLARVDDVPVATAATIRDGARATLEFVSTRGQYRRQGAATAICLTALRALREQGVRTVSLRASHEGLPLYLRLGFRAYCEGTAMEYRRRRPGR